MHASRSVPNARRSARCVSGIFSGLGGGSRVAESFLKKKGLLVRTMVQRRRVRAVLTTGSIAQAARKSARAKFFKKQE